MKDKAYIDQKLQLAASVEKAVPKKLIEAQNEYIKYLKQKQTYAEIELSEIKKLLRSEMTIK